MFIVKKSVKQRQGTAGIYSATTQNYRISARIRRPKDKTTPKV